MTALLILLMTINANASLTVSSPAFKEGGNIPSKYTCEDDNVNPELNIGDIPANTVSLALIVDDPDATNGTFDHWVMWNIPVQNKIKEHSAPGTQGKNGAGKNSYTGPCPPTGNHRYYFKVYALNTMLTLGADTERKALEEAMTGHILASGQLLGMYKKMKP